MDWGSLQRFFARGESLHAGTLALMVASALVALLVNTWGKRALELSSRPVSWLWRTAYLRLAPRLPFNITLRAYRKHVRNAFAKLETPVAPSVEVPRSRAFTPLRLHSAAGPEPLELFSFVEKTPRFVLLGGAGTGKTTLMKSLVVSILEGKDGAPTGVHPVLVVIRKHMLGGQSVEGAVVEVFEHHNFPGAESFVRAALAEGKLLLILDGLDELGENRAAVVGQILEYCERDNGREKPNRLIVTCRESSYTDRELREPIAHVVRVEPFSNRNIRDFLSGWPEHHGRQASSLYPMLQQDPQIRELCRNPLLLTLLAGIYLEEGSAFELPKARNQFYEKLLNELFVQRSMRKALPKAQFTVGDKRRILEHVSLVSASQGRDPEAFTPKMLADASLSELGKAVDRDALVRELVDRDGVIKRSGDELTFAHRTIHEYLAALEARRRRQLSDMLDLCEKRADLWQLFYFYCGRLDNVGEMEKLLGALCDRGAWHQAGRALTYIAEPVEVAIVDRITARIEQRLRESSELECSVELEILASIAQRPGAAFDGARRAFDQVIGELSDGAGLGSVSTLETVLAASPEMALPVCRRLIDNPDLARKAGGLRLLGEIDTLAALEVLVPLLADGDRVVRSMAAMALLPVAISRAQDLRRLRKLVPSREDTAVWPLGQFFPSNVALALLDACGNEQAESGGVAVPDVFRHALRARRLRERWSPAESWFAVVWRTQARCLRFVRWWLRARGRVIGATSSLAVAMAAVLAVATSWADRHDAVIIVRARSPHFEARSTTALEEIRSIAASEVTRLKALFPDQLGRLPWSGSLAPALPVETAIYPLLQHLAEASSGSELAALEPDLARRAAVAQSPEVARRLSDAIRRSNWPDDALAEVAPTGTWWLFLLAWAPITGMWLIGRRRPQSDPFADPPRQLAVELVYLPLLVLLQGSALLALFGGGLWPELEDSPAASVVKVVALCAPALLIQIIQRGFDRSHLWRQLWAFSAKCAIEAPPVPEAGATER
ncbi:MAG TPA: NACHT domain-containing protein [Polyangiaceae bacterium]|nr:NACHT domain-containing protein [Polyangiaceae bacterium]